MKKMLFIATLFTVQACSENQNKSILKIKTPYRMKPGRRFIDSTYEGDYMWVTTMDTARGIYFAAVRNPEGKWIGEIPMRFIRIME